MTIKTKEKLFEEDVEAYLTSPDGGYLKCDDKHSLLTSCGSISGHLVTIPYQIIKHIPTSALLEA